MAGNKITSILFLCSDVHSKHAGRKNALRKRSYRCGSEDSRGAEKRCDGPRLYKGNRKPQGRI